MEILQARLTKVEDEHLTSDRQAKERHSAELRRCEDVGLWYDRLLTFWPGRVACVHVCVRARMHECMLCCRTSGVCARILTSTY